ncbi:hypothetical protein H113_02797 [Trichophyton rubrum MR1459]|uniref:Uncharacterized protein n=1 Tax=Trichophyton rubrum (strain ATCC MYA-4607 / CBS 118892) TaxID=559305 RepID=A0A080WNT2_TRIRC|nr:uncharacterized protein TERG_12283 [Trichophyton rubrum CBS 118892]EZF96965.1 hypothetical protein H113_02797 [Trichophyton rubrum MR1459]KFL61950.1 hypothetical protein TERG_12283 [Trichophyton rubrum CBS 118892]
MQVNIYPIILQIQRKTNSRVILIEDYPCNLLIHYQSSNIAVFSSITVPNRPHLDTNQRPPDKDASTTPTAYLSQSPLRVPMAMDPTQPWQSPPSSVCHAQNRAAVYFPSHHRSESYTD